MGTHSRALLLASLAASCTAPPVDDSGEPDEAGTTDAGHVDAGPTGPILIVTTTACDFGVVPIHAFALCEVTVANAGDRDVSIDVARFAYDTDVAMNSSGSFDTALPGFGMQTNVFLPAFVAPGTATTLRLFAHPPVVGTTNGTFLVGNYDDVHEVALKVTGEDQLLAVARIESVNDSPPPWNDIVRPLDDVLLTADASMTTADGTLIVAWEWWLIEKPLTSHIEIKTPNAMTTKFAFESSGIQTNAAIDVAGTYRIGLRVTDAEGLSDETEFTFFARHGPGLTFELTWDSPSYDLDLHVIKGGGPWCSQNSCFYSNCNADSAFVTLPEWDGAPGYSIGDPRMNIDDLSGYGPEQITIDAPIDEVYAVGVHVYSYSISPVVTTVRVFVDGALTFESARALEYGQGMWEVAELVVFEGGVEVFPLDVVTPAWTCGF
jgi:hypothetical protein